MSVNETTDLLSSASTTNPSSAHYNHTRQERVSPCSIPMKRSVLLLALSLVMLTATVWILSDATLATSSSNKHRSTKKHDKKKKKQKDHGKTSAMELQMAAEASFHYLFQDEKGYTKFEASGMTKIGNDYYVIFDNLWSLAKVSDPFTPFSSGNILIEPSDAKDDSQYEAVFHHDDTFYAIRESVQLKVKTSLFGSEKKKKQKKSYHAIVEEIRFNASHVEDGYEMKNECRSEFEFEGDSKGFEGASGFTNVNGTLYILGLCEGNYCQEGAKHETGNGRLVLMTKKQDQDPSDHDSEDECIWKTVKVINIPSSANFHDYSDIDITKDGKVAITSQEDNALWIGFMSGIQDGILDPELLDFYDNENSVDADSDGDTGDYASGQVYYFPGTSSEDKESPCIYCNIEGVSFVSDDGNDKRIMAVSDKSKKKQSHWSIDEAIHLFILPDI